MCNKTIFRLGSLDKVDAGCIPLRVYGECLLEENKETHTYPVLTVMVCDHGTKFMQHSDLRVEANMYVVTLMLMQSLTLHSVRYIDEVFLQSHLSAEG